ncbi:hypothetical protein [Arsukibacterium sp. MJ3]|uniref:hypothetical protein n=1 Tax=Arsukibacterium sp. MJ3 TaxID=1632859 RepID=UPI00069B732B|nr:hypothetical protein [Arsukibacterium sp. MJ3]
MLSAELQDSIDSLRIKDVYIDNINANVFDRSQDLEQLKHNIQLKFGLHSFEIKDDGEHKLVCFKFDAGVRWVADEDSTDEENEALDRKKILAHIESDLIACYSMKKDLSSDSLRAFGEKNSGLHVWPYWRELLSSSCERLRLPKIMLPITQFQVKQEEPKSD